MRRSLDRSSTRACPYEILLIAKEARRLGVPVGSDTPIAARKPHIGYYLGAPVVSIPFGDLDALRATGAHYLLVSAAEAHQSDTLTPLADPASPSVIPEGLKLVARTRLDLGGGRYRPAALYAVSNPKPYRPSPDTYREPPRDVLKGMTRLDTLRLRLARWSLVWAPEEPISSWIARMSPAGREHPETLALEGDLAVLRNRIPEAREIYQKMLDRSPTDAAVFRLAATEFLLGNREAMERDLGGSQPRASAEAWYEAALPYETRGEFVAAIAPFAACVQADSGAAPGYQGLTEVLLQAGQGDAALRVLDQGLTKLPQDPSLLALRKQLEDAVGAHR